MQLIIRDLIYRSPLKSVVGDEYIFKDKPEKLAALKVLEDEVYKIDADLGNI